MGDEPYYIDKVADAFSKDVLSAEEQEFNQVVLYGKDIDTAQIIAESKQFPFGSEKRVVIIKEAQHLTDIEILDSYLDTVQPSTVLVICYIRLSFILRGSDIGKASTLFIKIILGLKTSNEFKCSSISSAAFFIKPQ